MSQGLGERQRSVLRGVEFYLRLAQRQGDGWSPHWLYFDPLTSAYWLPTSEVGSLDADSSRFDPRHRADRASVRRSVRSLHARGLVECRMMDVPVRQRTRFGILEDIVRNVLVVRITEAGRRYIELHNLAYPIDP